MRGAVSDGADPARPRAGEVPRLAGHVTADRQHVAVAAHRRAGWSHRVRAANDYSIQSHSSVFSTHTS